MLQCNGDEEVRSTICLTDMLLWDGDVISIFDSESHLGHGIAVDF